MEAAVLIKELKELCINHQKEVSHFQKLSIEELNYKTDASSWSILECIEHLNRYGDFYIPEIRRRIENNNHRHSPTFSPGLLGNYFAKSMLPKDNLNKMKTFEAMNPINSNLSPNVLDTFILQQEELLELLNIAEQKNLTKIKTSISISKWIKLRLGDTFRVLVYHNLRHIIQAKKLIK